MSRATDENRSAEEPPAGHRGEHRATVHIVGGGVTGLTLARDLARAGTYRVVLREAETRLGGKILTSPFAGLDAVDEGPDAFLTRVPDAVALTRELALDRELTSPTSASAAVWYPARRGASLHPIPEGLVLGVPAAPWPLARTRLLSWRGKARAALEPLLPRTSTAEDSLGGFVRSRVGDEVHERLVDALVGSIYAADTDATSLRSIPQLAQLAEQHRSLLLGARSSRARATAVPGPLFAAPLGGMGALAKALASEVIAAGGEVRTGATVTSVERSGDGWLVDGDRADQVVFATPARATAPLLRDVAPGAADLLGQMDHAGVIMVSLVVTGRTWPHRLRGRSGYLVPKPVQGLVTAASFGSQKWDHWRLPDGDQLLRVSLGRDGLPVDQLDDGAALSAAVDEVGRHLDLHLQPTATRVSRWPAAFPQYRPHHDAWVAEIERELPAGLHIAGASYRGIGIPACIRDARRIAACLAP